MPRASPWGARAYLQSWPCRGPRSQAREPPAIEGNPSYEPLITPIGDAVFRFLADIKKCSEGNVVKPPVSVDPEKMTDLIKGLAKYYGADSVGIARLQPDFYYSHRGREPSVYGQKIEAYHKYAIVFAHEMDRDMINEAPFAPEAVEVTKGYLSAAITGMALSYYLREIGYEARNHMDGNYLMPLPKLAEEAGLGEIGKIGVLVTRQFGPRIRLGAVTTNVELIPDEKNAYDILSFCNLCNNCALRCPTQAIPLEQASKDNHKRISDEKCYSVWKRVFTDCGICLASCPFSGTETELRTLKPPYEPNHVRKIVEEHNEKLHKIRMDPTRPHPWLNREESW